MDQATIQSSIQAMHDALVSVGSTICATAGTVGHVAKGDGSPVTEVDTRIEEDIVAYMKTQAPEIPVLGEEAGYDEQNLPNYCWLVDPIDGTKAFVEGVATYTSMAVLIVDGEAQAAFIYNPSTMVMYRAQKGQGAFRNDERIDLTAMPLPQTALCKSEHISALEEVLAELHVGCELAPNGGGYGFTQVLDGTHAARFQLKSGGYMHDYAPGALLIREAGGAIIPILDDVYTVATRSFVACHPALTDVVQRHKDTIRQLEA